MRRIPHLVVLASILAVAAACNSSETVRGTGSTVRLNLTDAPIDLTGVNAVEVTIRSITLYPTDGTGDEGGIPMTQGPISVSGELDLNLLDYQNGKVVFIGQEDVPPGPYQRIRLEISDARLLRDDDGDPDTPDVEEDVFVPSGKVDVPVPFTISRDETLELTLDFDAEASVQVNETPGQHPYILRPVITPVGMRKV